MANKYNTILIFLILFSASELFANGRLVSGPMAGHTTDTSTMIWIMVRDAEDVKINLLDETMTSVSEQKFKTSKDGIVKGFFPIKTSFENLKPGHTYKLKIEVDGKLKKNDFTVTTMESQKIKDFNFMLGSCAMSIPRGWQPIHPGIEERIYDKMIKIPSEFMLWLGDYIYYFPRDYGSPKGMWKAQTEKRTINRVDKFLQTRPQYIIWDDHDFGSNNSGADYKHRDTSLAVHQQFWLNPYFGTEELEGTHSHFSYYDTEFFLTDGRFYRTDEDVENPVMFGKEQMNWLFERLKSSTATFKFVAIGSQVLNEISPSECFQHYTEEYASLMNFIKNEKIEGVVFLTGDRHYTEVLMKENEGMYPLYDFTCSPISSFPRKVNRTSEAVNNLRVEGTLYYKHNFGRIHVKGDKGDRKCIMEIFDNKGEQVWEIEISENALKF